MRSRLEAALVSILPGRLESLVSLPKRGLFVSAGVVVGVNYVFESLLTWKTHVE